MVFQPTISKVSLLSMLFISIMITDTIASPGSSYLEDQLFAATEKLTFKSKPTVTQPIRTTVHATTRPEVQVAASVATKPIQGTTQALPLQRRQQNSRPIRVQQQSKPEEEELSFFDMVGKASKKLRRVSSMVDRLNPSNFVESLVEKTTPKEVKIALGVAENFLPGLASHCYEKITKLAMFPLKQGVDALATGETFKDDTAPKIAFKAIKAFMDYYENANRHSLGEACIHRFFKGDEESEAKKQALNVMRAGTVMLDLNKLIATTYDIAQYHKCAGTQREVPYFKALVPALDTFARAYISFMHKYESNNTALKYAQKAAEELLPILEASKRNVPFIPMLNPLLAIDKVIHIIKSGGMSKFMEQQMAEQAARFADIE